jgi:hypothetical protein
VGETGKTNPYLFVVGCPRSGTTLLQRMLDAHAQLTVANDTHFIPKAVQDLEVVGDLPLTGELVERVRGYHRFPRLGVPDEAVDEAAARAGTYGEFVALLYDALATRHGKPLAGEKTPDYCREIPVLHALFPAARFVHIVRDGRDVALSVLEWAHEGKGPGRKALWREQPVGVSALWWRDMVETGRRDGAGVGDATYHELRYEDLVADPAGRLRTLSRFLDLPYDEGMAGFAEGRTREKPGRDAKKAWLPATRGLRDWSTAMDERSVQLFEALAGDLLSDLGYPRRHERFPAEIAAVADRCRQWWDDDRAARPQRTRSPVSEVE